VALLRQQLEIERCPHCNVDRPSLHERARAETATHAGLERRMWKIYGCSRCGGCVLAAAPADGQTVAELYPPVRETDTTIPERARAYLNQALQSVHAPAGAVMLAASAVDAMLKEKGYSTGSLYSRIDQAATDHVITSEMALWAHEVRLEANDQRHSDPTAALPAEPDARRVIEFTLALAEFLFVLPARVTRGRATSSPAHP
jgi:hypothetical protein